MKKIISKSVFLAFGVMPLGLFAADRIELYNSPFCGCCKVWEDYMVKKGYEVKSTYAEDIAKIKEKYKIKPEYQSCHTGIIQGYVVEGHVPEDALKWLLENKPKDVIGISTPGMPTGSPGMEQGNVEEEYPVILMLKDGSYKTYGIYKGHKLIKKVI